MAQIGIFTSCEDGSFTGTIRTLTLNVEAFIQPVEKDHDKAPDYRVCVGDDEVGAAWKRVSRGDRPYLVVKLDDPSFSGPIYASLVTDDGEAHRLIWSR